VRLVAIGFAYARQVQCGFRSADYGAVANGSARFQRVHLGILPEIIQEASGLAARKSTLEGALPKNLKNSNAAVDGLMKPDMFWFPR
jgi:hypothetical protein